MASSSTSGGLPNDGTPAIRGPSEFARARQYRRLERTGWNPRLVMVAAMWIAAREISKRIADSASKPPKNSRRPPWPTRTPCPMRDRSSPAGHRPRSTTGMSMIDRPIHGVDQRLLDPSTSLAPPEWTHLGAAIASPLVPACRRRRRSACGFAARGIPAARSSPRRFDHPAELGPGPGSRPDRDRWSSRSKPNPWLRADPSRRKASRAVVGLLTGRQRVDAGDLIDGERFRIPPQRLSGVGVRGLAPAEPGVQYAPAGTGRHVVRVESQEPGPAPRWPPRCGPGSRQGRSPCSGGPSDSAG